MDALTANIVIHFAFFHVTQKFFVENTNFPNIHFALFFHVIFIVEIKKKQGLHERNFAHRLISVLFFLIPCFILLFQ